MVKLRETTGDVTRLPAAAVCDEAQLSPWLRVDPIDVQGVEPALRREFARWRPLPSCWADPKTVELCLS